jgi:hypothetical protein
MYICSRQHFYSMCTVILHFEFFFFFLKKKRSFLKARNRLLYFVLRAKGRRKKKENSTGLPNKTYVISRTRLRRSPTRHLCRRIHLPRPHYHQ